jgi:recombination protein RecA
MKKKTLEKEYYDNKLSQQKIADKYGIAQQTVSDYFRKYGLSPMKPHERNGSQVLSPIQSEFLIGTMLGDGYMRVYRNGINALLEVKQCIAQLEYVEWKYELMSDFVNADIRLTECYGFGGLRKFAVFNTICHPVFNDYFNIFYDRGVKVVTNEVIDKITPLAMAVWFMDDGFSPTRRPSYPVFCTNSFTPPEVERLIKGLNDKYGLESILRANGYRKGNNQKMYTIQIRRCSVDRFLDIVKPYIIPTMMYKIEPLLPGTSETECETPHSEGEDTVQTLCKYEETQGSN